MAPFAVQGNGSSRSNRNPSLSAPELPFGGIKRSGYGKALSDLGIEEFINKKLVLVVNGSSIGAAVNSI